MPRSILMLLPLLCCVLSVRADPSTRPAISMTIYGTADSSGHETQPFALVRQRRRLELAAGDNRVHFDDLPRSMEAASLMLRDLSGSKINMLDHSLVKAALTPDQMLATYIGRQVLINRKQPGNDERALHPETISAKLLAFDDKVLVLETSNRALPIEIIPRSADITEIKLMAGAPALRREGVSATIRSEVAGASEVEMTYRAGGLDWSAQYEVDLAGKEIADLSCTVSIRNQSGGSFSGAQVILAALSDRNEFPIPRGIELPDNSERQVLIASIHRPAHADAALIFDASAGGDMLHPVFQALAVENSPGNGLGKALPPGRVFIYSQRENAAPAYMGRGALGLTPRELPLLLPICAADGLMGQVHDQIKNDPADGSQKLLRQIRLISRRQEAATIIVEDRLPHPQAQLTGPADQSTRLAGSILRFKVQMPGGAEKQISYSLSWPESGR